MKKLIDIVAKLRSPDGCPWDRRQDHQSLIPFLLEESWEVVDEIKKNEVGQPLMEELGDLLLQIVLHAQIAKENNRFTMDEVIECIAEKLIERHPHVFKEVKKISLEDQTKFWHKKKIKDKNSVLDGISNTVPALIAALKIGQRASSLGFDWENPWDVLKKVKEELTEVSIEMEQNNVDRIEEEIGDLLFTITNLARFYHINPEVALKNGNQKFIKRFYSVEKQINQATAQGKKLSMAEMDELWDSTKESSKNK